MSFILVINSSICAVTTLFSYRLYRFVYFNDAICSFTPRYLQNPAGYRSETEADAALKLFVLRGLRLSGSVLKGLALLLLLVVSVFLLSQLLRGGIRVLVQVCIFVWLATVELTVAFVDYVVALWETFLLGIWALRVVLDQLRVLCVDDLLVERLEWLRLAFEFVARFLGFLDLSRDRLVLVEECHARLWRE